MSGEEEGVLEESGYLRVDREKALAKLSQYMLPSPELFLLPWARAAAANGAAHLAVTGEKELSVAFDGPPLPRGGLRDPYAALIAGSGDARLRQLAIGLLCCLATSPSSVLVESGPADKRFRLKVLNAREEVLEDAPPGGAGTLIRAAWALPSRERAAAAKAALRGALQMAPAGFLVDGQRAALAGGISWPWVRFEEAGTRVLMRASFGDGGGTPSLTLCHHGVAVEEQLSGLKTAPVQAWVDDPAFSLNASQSAVVKDAAHEKALAAAEQGCRRLAHEALDLAAARPVLGESRRELLSWLRAAASRHVWEKAPDPPWDRLRAAPVFEDCLGGELSVADMEAGFKASRSLPWSRRRTSVRLPWRVVYCGDERDVVGVRAMFGPDAVDVTRLVEGLPE